jgi:hypothetical protein
MLRLESLDDVLALPTVGCALALDDVYDKVGFEG